ncbi:hypothetical protein COV23_00785 [Candidatus Wolfebacteria bacterium CG10_big_fil_rev_8_21_14_0_10_31_9]|uniref:Transporter n=1 Tax=Candidatus Wolfebacteria bacterium CG10_big_fil_rev_8_21_14_0_10_31_9 TaxID=1975070 RepID=A0A2H0RCM0_9BACT|nr:MAG: hypothetical protein COV23_00785 [Candidatus Wolfebacteria bacterium CG10_big_fil_rev_8_21_14_0_10_31_9]
MNIFLISLPLFIIIFLGWLLKKYQIVSNDWIHILNNFAYYVSLPAIIISSFLVIDFSNSAILKIVFISAFTVLFFCLLIFFVLSILKISTELKATIFVVATIGNTIYMGLPLVELGLGNKFLPMSAVIGVIYLIIPLLISIFAIRFWHDKRHKVWAHVWELLKNPLTLSIFAGVILSFLNFNFPVANEIKKSITMLGSTASPIALFALGAFIHGRFMKKDIKTVSFVVFLKMILFPLAIFLSGFYLLKTSDLRVFSLLASTPVAVTTFVIAEKYNLNQSIVGDSIIISTILSFIVAPLILLIF